MSSAQDFDERLQREELAKNIDESIEANAKLLMSLNGAGFLAISTIAGLFHIDAAKMAAPVAASGVLFIAGAIAAGFVSVRRLWGLRNLWAALEIEAAQKRLEEKSKYAGPTASEQITRKLGALDLQRLNRFDSFARTNFHRFIFLSLSGVLFVLGAALLWVMFFNSDPASMACAPAPAR
jgi:hypothetical protein